MQHETVTSETVSRAAREKRRAQQLARSGSAFATFGCGHFSVAIKAFVIGSNGFTESIAPAPYNARTVPSLQCATPRFVTSHGYLARGAFSVCDAIDERADCSLEGAAAFECGPLTCVCARARPVGPCFPVLADVLELANGKKCRSQTESI